MGGHSHSMGGSSVDVDVSVVVSAAVSVAGDVGATDLADADAGNWGYVGLGFGVNFHKILNKISGRTKRLKARVDLDEKDKCMKRLKAFYTESIFEKEVLTEAQQSDYFYFCMDDQKFKTLCEQNNPIEVISFLNQKLVDYKINLNTKDD